MIMWRKEKIGTIERENRNAGKINHQAHRSTATKEIEALEENEGAEIENRRKKAGVEVASTRKSIAWRNSRGEASKSAYFVETSHEENRKRKSHEKITKKKENVYVEEDSPPEAPPKRIHVKATQQRINRGTSLHTREKNRRMKENRINRYFTIRRINR